MEFNIEDLFNFSLPIHNREKTLNISTSTNIHTSMVIQTKQVFKCVFTLKHNYSIFLHFDELGSCVYIKLKKYVTGP